MVGGCRWLQNRWWSVTTWVRRDRWSRAAAARSIRLGCQSRRAPWAGLRHLAAKMRRHVHVAHVSVLGSLAVHALCNAGGHADCWRHGRWAVVRRWCTNWRCCLGILLGIRAAGAARCRQASSQRSSSSSRSLLDRTSVVILVTRQGRPASKSLLAVGIGALVRPLARVNTAMAGQRARVAEWLCVMLVWGPCVIFGKDLPCSIARTCAASRPCGHVDEQSRLSVE